MATNENNIRRTLYKSIEQVLTGTGNQIKLFKVENTSQYTIRVYVDITIAANKLCRFALEVNNGTTANNYNVESYELSNNISVILYKLSSSSEDTYSIHIKDNNANISSYLKPVVRKEIVYGYLTDANSTIETISTLGSELFTLTSTDAKHIVNGNTNVKGNTAITGDVTADGDLSVTGNISHDGDVTTSGPLSITGAVDQTGDVEITNGANKKTTIKGEIDQTGNVEIEGNSVITGNVQHGGDVTTVGTLTIANGNVSQTGDVTIVNGSGKSTSINGNLTQTGNMSVSGTTTASNNFTSKDIGVAKTTTVTNNMSSKDVVVSETTTVSNTLNSKNTNTDTLNTTTFVGSNEVIINSKTTNTDKFNESINGQTINATTANAATLNIDGTGKTVNATTTNVATLNTSKTGKTVNADVTNTTTLTGSTVNATTSNVTTLNASKTGKTVNATTTNVETFVSTNIDATNTTVTTLNSDKTGKTINATTTNVATLDSTNVNADTTNVTRFNENKSYTKGSQTVNRVINSDTVNTATLTNTGTISSTNASTGTLVNSGTVTSTTTNTNVLNSEKGSRVIEANTSRADQLNTTINGQVIEANTSRAAQLNSEINGQTIEATTTKAAKLNTVKTGRTIEATTVNTANLNSTTVNVDTTKATTLNSEINGQTITSANTKAETLTSTNVDTTNANISTLNTLENRSGKVINADTTNVDTLNTAAFKSANTVVVNADTTNVTTLTGTTVNATTSNVTTLNSDKAGKTVNAVTTNASTLNTSSFVNDNVVTVNATTTNTDVLNEAKSGKTVNATTTNTNKLENSGTVNATTTNTATLNSDKGSRVVNATTTNTGTLNNSGTVNATTTNASILNSDGSGKTVNATTTNASTLTSTDISATTASTTNLNATTLSANGTANVDTARISGTTTFENMIVNGVGQGLGKIVFESSDGQTRQEIKGIYNEALLKVKVNDTFRQEDGIPLVIAISPTAEGLVDGTKLFSAQTTNEDEIYIVYNTTQGGLITVYELLKNGSATKIATLMSGGKYIINTYTAKFTTGTFAGSTAITVKTVFSATNAPDITIYKLQKDISTADASNILLTANSLRQILGISSLSSSSAAANLYRSEYSSGKLFMYQDGIHSTITGTWVPSNASSTAKYIPYLTKSSNGGGIIVTDNNVVDTIVSRNSSGGFSAGAISSTSLTASGKVEGSTIVKKESTNDDILLGDGSTHKLSSIKAAYESYTNTAISNLINGADSAYDTLKEIADWIKSDTSGALSLANRITSLESYFNGTDDTGDLAADKAKKLDHNITIFGQQTNLSGSTISGAISNVTSITHSGNITPTTDTTVNVGSSTKKYLGVYASTLYGVLDGNLKNSVKFATTGGADSNATFNNASLIVVDYHTIGAAPVDHSSTATTYGVATADKYGHIKVSAVRNSAITATTGGTTSGRYYGIELDSNGKPFVNIPWTDTNNRVDLNARGTSQIYLLGTSTHASSSTQSISTKSDTAVYITTTDNKIKLVSPYFEGNGSLLTALNAAEITSGTLSADRLATSGATAGSYGPSANASPSHGGTFTVPYVTVDNKGRVTSISSKTITLPADQNTDTLVNQNYSTDNASYPLLFTSVSGTSSASNRGAKASILNNSIYANPSTGSVYATKLYKGGNEVATIQEVNTLISNLGDVLNFKGTKNSEAEIKAISAAKKGDVWLDTSTGYEWVCIATIAVPNANAWQQIGANGSVVVDAGYQYLRASGSALTSSISASNTSTNERWYGVRRDKDNQLVVNVPWVNTTYSAGTGLTLTNSVFNHTNSVTAKTSYGSTATTASSDGGTITITDVKYDSTGHITGSTDRTITLSQNKTITANATDGIWDITGTGGTNAVTYAVAAHSAKGSTARFYTGSTNPTLTSRLNYDGYLYATKLYSGGTEVLTSHQDISGKLNNSDVDLDITTESGRVTIAVLKVGSKWIRFSQASGDAGLLIEFSTDGGTTWIGDDDPDITSGE